jgi:hypothetical protein
MSYQAYIDNIKAKTGKTPEDFLKLVERKGLLDPGVKTSEVLAWLKNDFGLQRGHGMAIVLAFKNATQPKTTIDASVSRHFTGARAKWRGPYQDLVTQVTAFGPGVSVGPNASYISLLRKGKKFAIVQPTADRLDVGIKVKGAEFGKRFEPAGTWNSMVTHRVRITDPEELDRQVLSMLRRAYELA